MRPRHLSAMANIAAQMAVNGDHIKIWMFYRRFQHLFGGGAYRHDVEQHEELFLVGEDAINAARDWIEGYLCRDNGRHVVPTDMDLRLNTLTRINNWFGSQEPHMWGGIIMVSLRL